MKIPVMTTVVAILLAACNPAKDNLATASVPVSVSNDSKSIVINAQRNIQAIAYVVGDAVTVQVGDQPVQRLTGINPSLYPDYKAVFFRTHDLNRDGLNEIAVLASASFGGVDLCYDVFHYDPATGKFVRRPDNFYCTHG